MAFGTESHLRLARQDSGGTAAATTTSFHSIPIVSESLVTAIPDLISDTIRARYEEGPSILGILGVQGDVVLRPNPDQMAVFLYAFTGVISSTQLNSCYNHVFVPRQTRFDENLFNVPWTIEKYAGVDEAHFYHDAQCARMTIEIAAAQYLRASANFMARTTSTAARTTPTFPSGVEWSWNQASISLASAAFVEWENVTLTMDNNPQFVAMLDGTKLYRRILRNGYRTFRITGTADLPNNDEYDRFRAGSEAALDITLKGLSISSGNIETLRVQIPSFRYTNYPIGISGQNRITVGFEGRAVYNPGSGYAAIFTVTNTRIAY